MRPMRWLAVAALAMGPAAPLLAFSCTSPTPSAAGGADASDAPVETGGFLMSGDVGSGPDANVPRCTLAGGRDPVALCTQKAVLGAMHSHAFSAKSGVASGWSPVTGLADEGDGGVRLRVWTDDVGYAAAAALYHTSAGVYGDGQLTPTLDSDLAALVPMLEADLTPLPDEYSGEPYQRLRVAAAGLRTTNHVTDGDAIDALADAYGRAIHATYFFAVNASPRDAGGDGASVLDSGHPVGDAAALGDAARGGPDAAARAPDANAPSGKDGIFGRPSGSGYAYLPSSSATAAYAMLDLAVRHPTDPSHASWQLSAISAFDHLYDRARDPSTGLYYTALITSGVPGHDALDLSQPGAADLLTDTTITVALALTRARDLVAGNASALALVQAYPFGARVADALASLNGAPSLYDGPAQDAGASATGFMTGLGPARALITSKATRGNAFALAVLSRQFFTVGTPWGAEIVPLTRTLIATQPAGAGLLGVLAGQGAYLAACSRSFEPLTAGEDAGPYAGRYQSAANIAFVEAMSELLPPQ